MESIGPTLNHVLDGAAEVHADKEAIVTPDERITYSEFHEKVRMFARGLLDLGVRKGDRVGVLLSNRPEWFIATYAIERIGATMVGMNTWFKQDELQYVLRKADVSVLVTVDGFLDNNYLRMLSEIDPAITETTDCRVNSADLPVLQCVIVVDNAPSWAISWADVVSRADAVSSDRLDAVTAEILPSDDAYILFSSGTTGQPKPIVLCHDGLVTNPRSIGSRLGVSADDRFWLALPLFFSFAACNESITALAHGATLVLQRQFDPEVAIDRIEAEECTIVYGMGNMFKQMECVDADLNAAFESVQIGLVVSPVALRERLETEHGIDKVLTCYGLTEVSAICAITHHEDTLKKRLHTEGRPLANVDIRIKDPDSGAEVSPGEEGEICIRSRTMFREYLKMPQKTREVFDADGYFHTGDIGWLDPDGRVIFEGRMKDMIKTGGINVSPQEVQNVLHDHPAVSESVVVGLPDKEKDEVVAAVVRSDPNSDVSEDEIIMFCEERMAAYKVPSVVIIRETDFPRTDTGKVRKFEVQEELLEDA
jgi:fatty-acyl-CoA synthase